MTSIPDEIRISEDGTTLPVIELLTGRGFVTGKSGSGKSNTASVIAEELLELDLPMLIIDTDGEYYGLKERYEMLHVGAGDLCDVQVSPTHAQRIATLALEENVPVILDVSEYLDVDDARELIHGVVKTLFVREKKEKKPFMLLVEECHEYLPESGGLDEVGEILLQVAKRGRKRGLGLCGMSQRPAAVDKDFITQCDWLVWHRLTWENDTKVVGRFLDNEYAEMVEGLDDGEAILVTDWDEQVTRVQFRRKKTFDAGATPGLEDVERPDFRTISSDLEEELSNIGSTMKDTDSVSDDGGGTAGGGTANGEMGGGTANGEMGGGGAADTGMRSPGLDRATEGIEDDDSGTDSTAGTASTGDAGSADDSGSTDHQSGGSDESGGTIVTGGSATDDRSTPIGSARSRNVVKNRGPKRPKPPSRRSRRHRRRGRDAAEENIVLEASHLVAYGVESTVWRIRRAIFRARLAARRSVDGSWRRIRRSGADHDLDPRLLAALLLGCVTLAVGLLLSSVVL